MAETYDDEEAPPEDFFGYVTGALNLVDDLGDGQAGEIANEVISDFDADKASMKDWLDRMERGLELAKLDKEEKTYPWSKASNIKYPLVTSAALQFNARAYPAIVPADRPVKVAVQGDDPEGQKADRAERMSAHMSWQVSSQIEEWEELTDRMLMVLPIVGTVVRKMWWDASLDRACVRMIEPGDFVVSDKVKSLADAPRMSEVFRLHRHEIVERERSGVFTECEYPEQDHDAPLEFIEQHRRIDLDEDGYAEPYIAVVCRETGELVRLVADFDAEDVEIELLGDGEERVRSITRGDYYTVFHFLPSVDGGFFGTGLGLLLGDISDAVNTMLNMITDAGHMQSLGGGFLGREFRMRGGDVRFRPGEWKMTQAGGQDMRNAIVPLDVPGPSPVLFQVLGLLIEAGREIASVKDIMTGDSGNRQQTATTTLALIEQGMMVFSAAYKRVFRALKREFTMLAKLNSRYLNPADLQRFHDVQEQVDPRAEYDLSGYDVGPVADPRAVTKMQEMARAQLLMELAQAGMVDPAAAARRVLEAASIEEREELAPEPTPEQAQMQQMQMQEEMAARRIALETADAEHLLKRAELAMKRVEIEKVIAEVEKTVAETEAERAGAIKDLTDADVAAAGVPLVEQLERLRRIREEIRREVDRGSVGGVAGTSRDAAPAGNAPARGGNPQGVDVERLLERVDPGMGGGGGGTPDAALMGVDAGPVGGGFGR